MLVGELFEELRRNFHMKGLEIPTFSALVLLQPQLSFSSPLKRSPASLSLVPTSLHFSKWAGLLVNRSLGDVLYQDSRSSLHQETGHLPSSPGLVLGKILRLVSARLG